MKSNCLAFILALWISALLSAEQVSAQDPPTSGSDAKREAAFVPPEIQAPLGFTVELAAGPPLVKYPMMACLDDRGRLFIAESDGQNLPKDELLRQRPRFVRMLEDLDGDGRFEKSTIFADQMIMPEGALWHGGALYLVSAPYLWRLEDTDGDGVADKREALVGEMDFIGNANQHGPYLSPTGRLYFSGGTFGYNLVGKDGKAAGKGTWAGVFSCRPDGTDVRIECHAGINPVEVAFTEEGDWLGTCAIFDMNGGRHDALAHWVHGGSYAERFKEPTLKQTGRFLPCVSRWGQVAPAGVVRYRGSHFGEEFSDQLFVCQFNTHAVVRLRLEREGATFRAKDEPFLESPSPDFHPADVLEDADGSLLVIDTGGWMTLGCPTSKIAKPEALGAVYRVRKMGGPLLADPRGAKLTWNKAAPASLVHLLDDPRPFVRDRALDVLAERRDAEAALRTSLRPSNTSRLRRNVVWALARIGTPDALAVLREALSDVDAKVRQAAVHSLGILHDGKAVTTLMKLVVEDEPSIRREAATALGLIGRAEAVPALLLSLITGRDEFLEHALIYALIEINAAQPTRAGLADPAPHVRRATLIALDQMADGGLTREIVAPLLDTADADLRATALDVIGRHSDWSDEVSGLFGKWLFASQRDPMRDAQIAAAVIAFWKSEAIQLQVAKALSRPETPSPTVLLLLETIARCELSELPAPWVGPLAELLSSNDERMRRQVVATVAALDTGQFDEQLLALSRDTGQKNNLRAAALAVVARRGGSLDQDGLDLLARQIDPDVAPAERLAAADALGKALLDVEQLKQLASRVKQAGPLELSALVRAFETAGRSKQLADEHSRELGLQLVDALADSPGASAVPAGRIQAVLDLYPPEVGQAANRRLTLIQDDSDGRRERLTEVVTLAAEGDPERGRQVFFSNRASCSACHRIAGAGGQVGPDLSTIGQVRRPRDLAESLLFPSATIANGYESYTIVTASGQQHTGLVRRDTAEAIHLVTTDRLEIRIPRDDIEDTAPATLSVMPQGLDKVITPEQLGDVIAFLASLK